jgi:hypothetical protein
MAKRLRLKNGFRILYGKLQKAETRDTFVRNPKEKVVKKTTKKTAKKSTKKTKK